MARLSYQNTAAPDFSSSLQGFGQMGRLLAAAADSSNALFANFRNNQAEVADRVLAERALAFQDPNALSAALADGSLVGNQAGRASAAGLQALGNRVGALTQQAGNMDTLNTARKTTTAREAARGLVGDILGAAQTGEPVRAGALFGGQAIKDLSMEDQIALAKTSQDLIGQNTRNNTAEFGLNMARAADRRELETARLGNDILRNSYDGRTALTALSHSANDDPRVEAALRRQFAELYPSEFLPNREMGLSGAGGGRAGGGGGVSRASSLMTGGAQLPDSIRTIGDMVDNKQALLGVNPKGTATGIYQITSDTWADFAPKALGANWRDADLRDPQVQDRVAESIWDSAKGSAIRIKGRWDSLTPEQAQRMVGMSWDEVRDVISQGESSVNASNLLSNPLVAADAIADVARADTMANANSSNRAIEMLASSQESRADAASRLVGEGGAFQGYSRGEIANQLRDIEARGKVNPAQAARILEDSLSPRSGLVSAIRSNLNPLNWINATSVRGSIPENTWDNALIQAGIDGVGQLRQDGSANRDRQATAATIQQTQERTAQLEQRVREVRRRASQTKSPGLMAEADRLEAQLQTLRAAGEALRGIQQGTQRYTATDLEAPARAAQALQQASRNIDPTKVVNVENLSPLEWSLYSRGLLPDSYFEGRR